MKTTDESREQIDQLLTKQGAGFALPVKEVAKLIGFHPRTVWRKIRSGELPAIQTGRNCRLRILRSDLAKYLLERVS